MPKSALHTVLKSLVVGVLFSVTTVPVFADTTPPSTTLVQTPSSPNGTNGWYITPIEFDLTATDLESGVKEIWYQVDGGTWQTVVFEDSLNLAPNPSFETAGATTANVDSWEATVVDSDSSYAQDSGESYSGFPVSSARTISTDGTGVWHGINNQTNFATASPFGNMTASAWIKTDSLNDNAYFKMYSVSQDGSGSLTYVELGQSPVVTSTTDWTFLDLNFVVNDADSIGVYMDIGLEGSGTIWVDAVTISDALTSANAVINVADDAESHSFEYYAVDVAGNSEAHGCPSTNCVEFKLDQTPPGAWYDSGAFRGFFGPSYMLWTYTNVRDATSGLSVFSDKYQIKTELNPEFGMFSNFLSCSSTWLPDNWLFLITPPFTPGAKDVFLLAPKTSFCNSNWNICKLVKFYTIDMAGNVATKDFCVNGPWIRVRGEGWVRANAYIDLLAEGDEDNTDGLIEVGQTLIDFFTSTRDWEVTSAVEPALNGYNEFWDDSDGSKTQISDGNLQTGSTTYYVSGDFTIDSGSMPSGYDTDVFDQVVFINGNLTISDDVDISESSTALFIVSGDVNIAKTVTTVELGIFADGDIYTAYDIVEGDSTEILVLNGMFSADEFILQRTLVGTSNSNDPSEDFIYEPKYTKQLQGYFGAHSINWRSVE